MNERRGERKEFMIFALNRNIFMMAISRRAKETPNVMLLSWDETHFNCVYAEFDSHV